MSAPVPFARLSDDESRILVVRSGDAASNHPNVRDPTLSNGTKIAFLSLFPTSGVYRWPDRSLIYEIDWYCLDRELLASADLGHLARLNRFGSGWALKFYSSGHETNTYTLDQLLTAFRSERFRPYATWDWHHPWHEEFDLAGEKVTLTTVNREIGGFPIGYHEVHTFDITTGTLIGTDDRNGRLILLIFAIGGLFLILLTSVVFAVRTRRSIRLEAVARQPA